MVILLGGPMSGLPDDNRPAHARAAARLRALGHEVTAFIEAETREETAARIAEVGREQHWRECLARTLRHVMQTQADGLALLRGWTDSRGSCAEAAAARARGLPVLDAETLAPVEYMLVWVRTILQS